MGGQERRDVECQEGGGAMVRVVACVGTGAPEGQRLKGVQDKSFEVKDPGNLQGQ